MDYLTSLCAIQLICVVIAIIAVIAWGVIRSFLALLPAKIRDDLQGKRKVAIIISGLLIFLATIACGVLGYTVVFSNYPSLVVLLVILFMGLVFGVGQVVKLNFIDNASVKTYEWLDRSEKEKEG